MPPNLPRSMPLQIYQAWLQGPHALFRLFEDSFGRQALYGPPDPDQQQRTIDALFEKVGQLKAQIGRLQAEVSDLRGRTTSGEFPGAVRSGVRYGPGVKARVLYLQQYQLLPYQRTSDAMRDLFGCHLSAGTVANIVRECAAGLVETELKIKKGLRRSPVIHADEMGLRVEGKLACVHVASSAHLTHYAADVRRGKAAIDEIASCPLTAARASTTGGSLTRTTRTVGTPCAGRTCCAS